MASRSNRSLFVPVSPGTVATTGQQGTSFVSPIMQNPYVAGAKMAYDAIPQATKDQIVSKGKEAIENYRRRPPRAGRPGRLGGGGDRQRNQAYNESSGFSLTSAPNPRETSLNSGIHPNTWSPDYLIPELNKCSPLHMTGVLFQFPTNAANKLLNYFTDILAFDLQTKAQVNITFNLDVTNNFSAAKILVAFNVLVKALQYYFYYMSIISYHSDPTNKNDGMIYLRKQLTPQIIEDLTNLGRILADIPVPPRLYELLRYLSGTYLSGDNQDSALIKTFPITPTATLVNGAELVTSLNDLTTSDNVTIFSLMRRAIPQWSPKTLNDVDPKPVFDKQYLTIFSNLPFLYHNGTTLIKRPQVASYSTEVAYNTFTPKLDGVAYALTSIFYLQSVDDFLPGLMTVSGATAGTTTTGNTRWSYYTNASSVKGFYNSGNDKFLTRSRQDTYSILDDKSDSVELHLYGADKCSNVNISSLNETTFKVLDYLMSADTIKTDVRKFHFGTPDSRRR